MKFKDPFIKGVYLFENGKIKELITNKNESHYSVEGGSDKHIVMRNNGSISCTCAYMSVQGIPNSIKNKDKIFVCSHIYAVILKEYSDFNPK